MNQTDKAEALRLMQIFEPSASELDAFAKLRALIERQNDTDGEMWRFCVRHGFPAKGDVLRLPYWKIRVEIAENKMFQAITRNPAEAVQAAMAAMKEKA